MALRAVNTCSLFRTASPPPLFALQYHFCHFKTLQYGRYIKFGFQSNIIRCDSFYCHGGSIRSCSVHSLVNSVMEELAAIRKRKRVCSAIKCVSILCCCNFRYLVYFLCYFLFHYSEFSLINLIFMTIK